MGWGVVARGECADERHERWLIDRLRLAFAAAGFGAGAAILHSDTFGPIDLLDTTGFAVDETEVRS